MSTRAGSASASVPPSMAASVAGSVRARRHDTDQRVFLSSSDGSLLGVSADGEQRVLVVRRGQAVYVDERGVSLKPSTDTASQSASQRGGSQDASSVSPQRPRYMAPAPQEAGEGGGVMLQWMTYERSSVSKGDYTVVERDASPKPLPKVRLTSEDYMLVLKHKQVSFVYNGRREFLIFKPGYSIQKEDIAVMFDLRCGGDRIVLKSSPNDSHTLCLPLQYHSVSGEGAEFFVVVKGNTVVLHRDKVLFDWDGQRSFHVQLTSSATIESLQSEIASLVPDTPDFEILYSHEEETLGDRWAVTSANVHSLPEGSVLYHTCKPKTIIVVDPNDASKRHSVAVSTQDSFTATYDKINAAFGGSPGYTYLLREEVGLSPRASQPQSIRRLDHNAAVISNPTERSILQSSMGSVAGRHKDLMPHWRALEDGKRYDVARTEQSLSFRNARGSSETVYVSALSDPVADVENAFSVSSQFFSLDGGAAAGNMTAELKPLRIEIFTPEKGPLAFDVVHGCGEDLAKFIEEATSVRRKDWTLRPTLTAPPLTRPYHFDQFCRSNKTYRVTLEPKRVLLSYCNGLQDTVVMLQVGSTHAENCRIISQLIGSSRDGSAGIILYAKKLGPGGTTRLADVPLTPETAASKGLEVLTDISWSNVQSGQRVTATLADKTISIMTEECWPEELLQGPNEVSVTVGEYMTRETIWQSVVEAFSLNDAAGLTGLPLSAFYLTTVSCGSAVKHLSYATLRDGVTLLLCMPRKVVSVVHAVAAAEGVGADCEVTVLPNDTHSDTLKAVEAHYDLLPHSKYRLFGPYDDPDEASRLLKADGLHNEKLAPSALGYDKIAHGKPSFFLLCPAKQITVVHKALGVRSAPISISVNTQLSAVLTAVAAAFPSPDGSPHLEGEDGHTIESLTYLNVDVLEQYYAVWRK
eukprot:Rhum_TRINITY_DN20927_c0_g1::Rhum_TRINITY_DN20927_c0_g1_i1::g.172643::m.172643